MSDKKSSAINMAIKGFLRLCWSPDQQSYLQAFSQKIKPPHLRCTCNSKSTSPLCTNAQSGNNPISGRHTKSVPFFGYFFGQAKKYQSKSSVQIKKPEFSNQAFLLRIIFSSFSFSSSNHLHGHPPYHLPA